MDVEAERRAVLAAFEASQAAILAAIDGLAEAQLTERSIDGWSVKDHLAHLAQWHELRWLDLTRLAAGYESAVNSTPDAGRGVQRYDGRLARLPVMAADAMGVADGPRARYRHGAHVAGG